METDYEKVTGLFPPGTKIIQFTGSPDKYTALLRCKCKSKEEFRQNWLNQYEKLSRVTLRVLLTRPKAGKTVVYKAAFRCQHNTYPSSHQRVKAPHRKHTGCPAILKVTIKTSPENRLVRSMDTLREEYPTIISIVHEHNHPLPRRINLSDRYYSTSDGSRISDTSSEALVHTCLNSALVKKDEKLEIDEPNWNFLKHLWISFLERCESSNSIHLYRALLKATHCLQNCKTVNSTIAALNSIGKKINKQKCDAEVLVHAGSVPRRKRPNNGLKRNSENLSIIEVSDGVEELLVVKEGWIMD